MKKIAIIFAIVGLLLGCSNEPQLNLNTTQVEMYALDEHLITSDGTNVHFSSRNPYIATVNETTGVVTARTIGETIIDVTADQGNAVLKVIVKPKHHLYTEPCVDFTKTKDEIVSMFGTPDSDTDSGIMYAYAVEATDIHIADMYLFGSNDILSASCALINESAALDLVEFLCERYVPVDIDGGSYYLVNGISDDTITMVVMVTEMSGYTINQVIYAPYSKDTRAYAELRSAVNVPLEAIEAYRE